MTDTYQAIYDAVRSKLSNGDIGAAIRDACHLDASHAIESIRQEFLIAASEMYRPSVLYKPRLRYNQINWFAEYPADAAPRLVAVCGVGDSPAEAMSDFDRKWK